MTTILDAPLDVDAGTVTHFLLGGGFGIPAPVPEPEPEPEPGSDLWGDGQAISVKLVRGVGSRGMVFALAFESNEAGDAWGVYRSVAHLRARRNPSVVRTEQ